MDDLFRIIYIIMYTVSCKTLQFTEPSFSQNVKQTCHSFALYQK